MAPFTCVVCKHWLVLPCFVSQPDGTAREHKRCPKCLRYQPYPRLCKNTKTATQPQQQPAPGPATSSARVAPSTAPTGETERPQTAQSAASVDLPFYDVGSEMSSPPCLPRLQAPAPAPTQHDGLTADVPSPSNVSTAGSINVPSCPITGFSLSGAVQANLTPSQARRQYVVPKQVRRITRDDFPVLEAPLEEGMVVRNPGCLNCIELGIHCTYGAGVQLDGSRRDPKESFCDSCKHDNLVCSFSRQQAEGEACPELSRRIRRLDSKVDAYVSQARATGQRIALKDSKRLSREAKALRKTLKVLLDHLGQEN